MLMTFGTPVVISKGYNDTPALKYSENNDSVRFRVGYKVYDTRAENNSRWVNFSVKAFGPLCERIKNMKLKEGSLVTILGRLDEDTWEDATTGEKKSVPVLNTVSVVGTKKPIIMAITKHRLSPLPPLHRKILLHLKILQDLKHLAAEILSLMNKEDTEQLNQAH